MIIDIHAHIWRGKYEEDKREILRACEMYGVTKVFISGLGSYYPADNFEVEELNREVGKFMREHPDTIGGFCYVSPLLANCLDILKKGVEQYGMAGMKLWVATFCDDPRVFSLVEKCIDYNIPVLVHAFFKANGQLDNESTGLNVANLAGRYPEAKIIMAHLGSNCYHGIKAIRGLRNVSVDISGSIFRKDDIDYTKEQVGAERILFGTDMPGSFLVNLGQVEEADLNQEEKELIYYKNALRMLERTRR